ncbi:MAG: DUF4350 domain-containing protein [Bacteroidota bacterium]
MNSRTVITVVVGSIIGLSVLLLVYFYITNNKSQKYSWYQNFDQASDQPYGTMFIKKMLEASHSGTITTNQKEPIHKLLEGKNFKNTDYVLIGQSIYLDDEDVAALKDFLVDGNNVFIATLDRPEKLVGEVYANTCDAEFGYEYTIDTTAHANFYHPTLHRNRDYDFRFRMGNMDFPYFWRYLNPSVICDSSVTFTSLGYQGRDQVNFLRITYGAGYGHLYLHTVPLMFTNYFMTKPDNMEYASSVFTHLSGENLIWDEVSKVPFMDMQNPYDSPLYYIMQQPALKYAWWMLLAGTLLYILFASKRTQRIIPVLEPKTNTSLEFLNVISSLHYQNPDHLDMARKKMKYFLYFIRARYGINTQTFTQELVTRLAERAKVDVASVQAIHDSYRTIESYATFNEEPERLIALYQAIDKFYKTCK